MAIRLLPAAALCAAIAFLAPAPGHTQEAALRQIAAIDLPGPANRRFDYLVIDYDDGWLFSAHLAANQTYVIDLKTHAVLHTIRDTPGVEGLEYVPELRKVYASNSGNNTVGVIDLATMTVVRKIPTERKPDGNTYAAPFRKLYVSDERAKAVAVIDVDKDAPVTMVRFDSETGVPIYDPKSRQVLVNLQDRSTLAAIDPATDKAVAEYKLDGCVGNHGMALDVDNRRAFIACEGNDRLVVFDLERHRILAQLPIPPGSDVVQFDPGLRRAYVACGVGAIAVIQEDDPDHFRKLADVPVERTVHSLAVDLRTHRVYAPAQQEAGRGAARLLVFEALTP